MTWRNRAQMNPLLGRGGRQPQIAARVIPLVYRLIRPSAFAAECTPILEEPISVENLHDSSELQPEKREQQPSRCVPVPFAGNGLMINEKCGGQVGEAVYPLPVFRAERADRPEIARQSEHDKNRQSRQTKPGEWFGQTSHQPIPAAFVENVKAEMEQAINARRYSNGAAMPVQRHDQRACWKQNTQRRQ